MLLAFGTCVSGDCFHVCLPKIKESENEYPHQVDEVPVQAGDLHRLIAPLTVIESAPNPQSYDSQVDNARRYVQAVEPGDHKETRSKLCRAQWVPRPARIDRKSTRLNSSHEWISYAVF